MPVEDEIHHIACHDSLVICSARYVKTSRNWTFLASQAHLKCEMQVVRPLLGAIQTFLERTRPKMVGDFLTFVSPPRWFFAFVCVDQDAHHGCRCVPGVLVHLDQRWILLRKVE